MKKTHSTSVPLSESMSLSSVYAAWGAVALFFLYQYILRVAPGVMVHELRQTFFLSAEQFSLLGSVYLYTYSLLQIPLGIVLDRIGIRKTILSSILLCLGGTLLFAQAEEYWVAVFARVLIGAGSATAFMGSLKLITDRFPEGKRGLLMGVTLALGTFGALTAGKPLALILDIEGWRSTLLISCLCGLPVLVFAFFTLPKRKSKAHKDLNVTTISHIFEQIWVILKNRSIMLYAFLAIGVYTPLSVIADLWGTAFLMEKYGLARPDAAQATMILYVGLAAGSLTLPYICEKYNILNRSIQICTLFLLGSFCALLFAPNLSLCALNSLTFAVGFFCGAEMLCFAGALSYAKADNSGVTIGVVNTLNMLGGAILQWLIGHLLDFQWTGALAPTGLRHYSASQYVWALSVLIGVIGLCLLASLFLKRRIARARL